MAPVVASERDELCNTHTHTHTQKKKKEQQNRTHSLVVLESRQVRDHKEEVQEREVREL